MCTCEISGKPKIPLNAMHYYAISVHVQFWKTEKFTQYNALLYYFNTRGIFRNSKILRCTNYNAYVQYCFAHKIVFGNFINCKQ